jgi:hypothetical protein
MRQRIAISCARRIFVIVSGHHEPGLHRGVVGDHHHFAALHPADPGDHAGARRLTVVLVVRHEHADLDPGLVRPAAGRCARAR